MATELKVNDSGTWRLITELKVNDSGTWRTIKDVKVNDSGTWRLVYSGLSFAGTMTEGSADEGGGPFAFGYVQGGSVGTLSPDTDSNGKVVYRLYYDSDTDIMYFSILSLVDLTQSYFTTLVVDAASLTSAAASYDYGVLLADASTWYWTTNGNTFGFDGSGTRAVSYS